MNSIPCLYLAKGPSYITSTYTDHLFERAVGSHLKPEKEACSSKPEGAGKEPFNNEEGYSQCKHSLSLSVDTANRETAQLCVRNWSLR